MYILAQDTAQWYNTRTSRTRHDQNVGKPYRSRNNGRVVQRTDVLYSSNISAEASTYE